MFAFLRMVVVVCGCLGLIGISFSTISAHPFCFDLAAPAPSAAVSRRPLFRRRDDTGSDDQVPAGPSCASYSRYSSDLQSNDSIADQQRVCREWAGRNGHHIDPRLEFFDEAVSGTKLRRQGLDAMLAAAAEGRFPVLYFHSLSRLARESVITMPMLKRLVYVNKVRVISASEGIDSDQDGWDLMATILSIQHERYVKDLSANVLRGQEGALLGGFSVGDYCFGYTSVPVAGTERGRGRGAKPRMVYAVDPETAVWVARIFHWFVEERRSLRWITQELNRLEAPKDHRATTSSWHHQYLTRLLGNRKYIGYWPWGQKRNVRNPLTGQVVQEDRPDADCEKWVRHLPDLQIIDTETFEKAQALLEQNRRRAANRRSDGKLRGSRKGATAGQPRHLLSGLIRCGACGEMFYVGGTNGKYLFCPGYRKGLCSCQTQLHRERAERMILDELGTRILSNPLWSRRVFEESLHAWRSQEAQLPSERASAEKVLAELDQKIERLLKFVEDGEATATITKRLAEREAERDALARRLERLRQADESRRPEPTLAWVEDQLRRLGDVLSESNPAAAVALRDLVGGQIAVQEIRRDGYKRHYLQGRFTIRLRAVLGVVSGDNQALTGNADLETLHEEIVIDFVDSNPLVERSEQAKKLYDEKLMNTEIASVLGCGKGDVTKLLKFWFESRGLEMPDGRSRRSQLERKHVEPPPYQEVADDVKRLADEGLLFQEIAEQLDLDRNTVTAAFKHWYTSRELEAPDGRSRRATLERKTSRRPHDDERPDSDAPAA